MIFEDRLLGEDELFEKASLLAALWVSTNKEVRDFPFILWYFYTVRLL